MLADESNETIAHAHTPAKPPAAHVATPRFAAASPSPARPAASATPTRSPLAGGAQAAAARVRDALGGAAASASARVTVADLPACLALDAQQLDALAARRESESRGPEAQPVCDDLKAAAPPAQHGGREAAAAVLSVRACVRVRARVRFAPATACARVPPC